MSGEGYRGYHDVGGLDFGDVAPGEQHDYAFWEKRVDALLVLLSHPDKALLRVDELRRGIEDLGPEAYDSMTYYDRWISSIANILVEKGVVGRDELEARIAALKATAAGEA